VPVLTLLKVYYGDYPVGFTFFVCVIQPIKAKSVVDPAN